MLHSSSSIYKGRGLQQTNETSTDSSTPKHTQYLFALHILICTQNNIVEIENIEKNLTHWYDIPRWTRLVKLRFDRKPNVTEQCCNKQ